MPTYEVTIYRRVFVEADDSEAALDKAHKDFIVDKDYESLDEENGPTLLTE